MKLAFYYSYHRVDDFTAQGCVFDHNGNLVIQKADLPILIINWLNGQMIDREGAQVPVETKPKLVNEPPAETYEPHPILEKETEPERPKVVRRRRGRPRKNP